MGVVESVVCVCVSHGSEGFSGVCVCAGCRVNGLLFCLTWPPQQSNPVKYGHVTNRPDPESLYRHVFLYQFPHLGHFSVA